MTSSLYNSNLVIWLDDLGKIKNLFMICCCSKFQFLMSPLFVKDYLFYLDDVRRQMFDDTHFHNYLLSMFSCLDLELSRVFYLPC